MNYLRLEICNVLSYLNLQAYHSSFTKSQGTIGNMALLPIKTTFRGPAPLFNNKDQDIIDEALYFFKANVFFRTYEIKVVPWNESEHLLASESRLRLSNCKLLFCCRARLTGF